MAPQRHHMMIPRLSARMTPLQKVMAGGAIVIYAGSAYLTYHYYRVERMPAPDPRIKDPEYQRVFSATDNSSGNSSTTSIAQRFAEIASTYDKDISMSELFLRMKSKRMQAVSLCHGDVLEISAGTGRNLDFFAEQMQSHTVNTLVITDKEDAMLKVAESRYENARRKFRGMLNKVFFRVEDASRLSFAPNQFDTIIDTFGLCSHSDPTRVLKECARVLKPNGQIILLEHGRSKLWKGLDLALDKTAKSHAEKWGCWWNRDIQELVENSGLEIVDTKQWHFGTTYLIVCRPSTTAGNVTTAANDRQSQ